MKQLNRYFSIVLMILATLALVGCAASQTQESTGEYLDDSVITTKVKTAILGDAVLKVNEIKVVTFKGVVQLSGFVSSQEAINQAIRVTQGVRGVKSIKNDMRVK